MVAAGALALWALAWFGGPPLLKSQIEKRGSQALGRELRVDAIEVSPRLLAVTLQGLRIAGTAGGTDTDVPPLLQIERVHLDLHMRSLWRLAPVVEAMQLTAPRLHLTRLGDGRYDIDDLIERFAPADPPQADEPLRFALFNLQLSDGELIFDDRPVGRIHRLGGIRLDLPFLSNLPDDVQIEVEPRLAFVLDGSAIDIGGTTTPFAQGRRSAFELRFDKLPLDGWWVYWPKHLPVRASGGVLDSALSIDFEQRDDGRNSIVLRGRVDIDGIALRAAHDDAPLLQWSKLAVMLDEVRPLERRVGLQSVRLEGLRGQLRRDAQGRLQLPGLAAAAPGAGDAGTPAVVAAASAASAASVPVPAAPPSTASAASAASAGGAGVSSAWSLSLAKFEIDAARIDFSDDSTTPPTQLALDAVTLSLTEVRWPVETDAALTFRARLLAADQPSGDLDVKGQLNDRQARLELSLQDLQLVAAAPYLRPWLRPQVSGSASAEARIDWAWGAAAPRQLLDVPMLRVTGFALDDLLPPTRPARRGASARAGKAAAQTAAAVAAVEIADLRADLLQRQLSIGAVRLQDPDGRVAARCRLALRRRAMAADGAARRRRRAFGAGGRARPGGTRMAGRPR